MRKPPKCSALSVTLHGFPFFLLVLPLLLHGPSASVGSVPETLPKPLQWLAFPVNEGNIGHNCWGCNKFKRGKQKPFLTLFLKKSDCPLVYSKEEWKCEEGGKCSSNKGLALVGTKDKQIFKLSVFRYSRTRPKTSIMLFCAGPGVKMTKKWTRPTYFWAKDAKKVLKIENNAKAKVGAKVFVIKLLVQVCKKVLGKSRAEWIEKTLTFKTSKGSDCFIISSKASLKCQEKEFEKCDTNSNFALVRSPMGRLSLSFFDGEKVRRPDNTVMAFCAGKLAENEKAGVNIGDNGASGVLVSWITENREGVGFLRIAQSTKAELIEYVI